jgi:heat shock protein HtpX
MAAVFFIAKFFEARADMESAIKMGQPKVMASALRKIGYRRIQMERMSSSKIGKWFGLDPHPPISFRIDRLETMKDLSTIKYPFVQSVKDCIKAVFSEFKKIK